MKNFIGFLCIFLAALSPLKGASDTFIDYQNYNHGYCPDCNCYPCRCDEGGEAASNPSSCGTTACAPRDPCNPAPVCGTNCGISIWWIGLIIAGAAAAGAIIISAH